MCSWKSSIILCFLRSFNLNALDFIKVKINSPAKKIKLFSEEKMRVSLLGKVKTV